MCIRCTAISCARAMPGCRWLYSVDRVRGGGSFSTRRVTAIQKGHPIFTCSASFQYDEEGFEHQSTNAGSGRTRKTCPRSWN